MTRRPGLALVAALLVACAACQTVGGAVSIDDGGVPDASLVTDAPQADAADAGAAAARDAATDAGGPDAGDAATDAGGD